MGSRTSGNRKYDRKKPIVENCRVLDLIDAFHDVEVYDGCTGEMSVWQDGDDAGEIGYEIRQGNDTLYLVLRYHVGFAQRLVELPVTLEVTWPHFGGYRWWARCPFDSGRGPCGRRIAKLYLPPFEPHFGCRHCFGLTYRSSQEQRTAVARERFEDYLDLLAHLNKPMT